MRLNDNELFEIEGGAAKGWKSVLFIGIGGLITLIVGIIDGYFNPQKCNN